MHYYKRNIGDYAKKAGRLSMLEHGAYTVLIDACYDRERFPTLDDAIEWTWARTDEEIAAVRFVLGKFFVLIDGVYVQERIREEIDKYHENASINKRIALDREESRKTNRARTVHEPSPNQEPRTNKPLTKNKEPLKTNAAAFALPEWINRDDWDLWMQTRKGKKMIPAQMQAQVNKLQKWKAAGIDYASALKASAEAGWLGLFEPKQQRGSAVSSQSENDQIREAARKRLFGEKPIETS